MYEYSKLDNVTFVQDVHTNQTCLYNLTPQQEKTLFMVSTYLEVYGQLIVCVGGLFLNSLAVLIFVNKKKLLSVFFNRLLLCLMIMDNLYLSITILGAWLIANERLHYDYTLSCTFFYFVCPIKGIIMCCTIYMTVILALERYNAITRPQIPQARNLQVTEQVTWSRVLKFVGPIVLICILFKSPLFWEFNIEVVEDGERDINNKSLSNNTLVLSTEDDKTHDIIIHLALSNMRQDQLYVLLYINLANLIFTCLLPLGLMVYFNVHVYRGLLKFNQRRASMRPSMEQNTQNTRNNQPDIDKSQSVILLAIVLIFIICHTLRIFLNIEDWIHNKTRIEEMKKGCTYGTRYWVLLTILTSEILLRLNSSLNFFIYFAFNNSFRSVICRHISKMLNMCGNRKDRDDSEANNYELHPLNPHQ